MLKIYPVALALLLVLVYPRRLGLRLLLALALLAALPFLMQEPGYVLRQYQLWYERVAHGDSYRRCWPLVDGYRDLWQIIRAWEMPDRPAPVHPAPTRRRRRLCRPSPSWRSSAWGRARETLFAVLSLATAWMLVAGAGPGVLHLRPGGPHAGRVAGPHGGRPESPRPLPRRVRLRPVDALRGRGGPYSPMIRLYQASGLQPLGVILYSVGFVGSLAGRLIRPATAPGRRETAPALSRAA